MDTEDIQDTQGTEDMDTQEEAYILVNMLRPPAKDILNSFQQKDHTEIMFQNIELNTDLSSRDILITKKYILIYN